MVAVIDDIERLNSPANRPRAVLTGAIAAALSVMPSGSCKPEMCCSQEKVGTMSGPSVDSALSQNQGSEVISPQSGNCQSALALILRYTRDHGFQCTLAMAACDFVRLPKFSCPAGIVSLLGRKSQSGAPFPHTVDNANPYSRH